MRDGIGRRRDFHATDYLKDAGRLTFIIDAGNNPGPCALESEAAGCQAPQAASTTMGAASRQFPLARRNSGLGLTTRRMKRKCRSEKVMGRI